MCLGLFPERAEGRSEGLSGIPAPTSHISTYLMSIESEETYPIFAARLHVGGGLACNGYRYIERSIG
jgi:hypothetical protein